MTTGLILAGGKSSRFLTGDKALYFDIQYHKTWLAVIVEKLQQLPLDHILISVSADNKEKIAMLFPNIQLIEDPPDFQQQGPLAGILSAAKIDNELLITSVDYPEISVSSYQKILSADNAYARDTFTLSHLNFSTDRLEAFLAAGNRRVKDFLAEIAAQPVNLPATELINHNEK